MTKQPSVKQMYQRMTGGHVKYLRRAKVGEPQAKQTDSVSWLRGVMKIGGTLRNWGAVTQDGQITEIGEKLLQINDQPR